MSGIRKSQQGFSLIEVLVVVVIIALGASIISFSVGDRRGREMRDIAKRFAAFAQFATEESAMTGELLGLKWVSPEEQGEQTWSYRWYRYRDGLWSLAQEPMTETVLPDYVDVLLEIDGQGLIKKEETTSIMDENIDGIPEEIKPEIIFFSSGEVTPFKLELRGTDLLDDDQHISVDLLGRIKWEEAQIENEN